MVKLLGSEHVYVSVKVMLVGVILCILSEVFGNWVPESWCSVENGHFPPLFVCLLYASRKTQWLEGHFKMWTTHNYFFQGSWLPPTPNVFCNFNNSIYIYLLTKPTADEPPITGKDTKKTIRNIHIAYIKTIWYVQS